MGCLLVIVLGTATAALIFAFGYPGWVWILLGVLWLAALVVSLLRGHQGFGGHGNTDLQIVIAGLFLAAVIMLPDFVAHKHCDQARAALAQLAEAEKEYLAGHETYAARLDALNLTLDPNVTLTITGADERSFVASASHRLCLNDDKSPAVFSWDSARDGLQ